MTLTMEGFILQKDEQMKTDRIVIQVLNQIADRSEKHIRNALRGHDLDALKRLSSEDMEEDFFDDYDLDYRR